MWEWDCRETINAPPEAVFEVMRQIEAYPAWNPFIVRVDGEAREGGVVSGLTKLGGLRIPFSHEIYQYIPGQCIAWKDTGLGIAFVCGDRSRTLTPVEGATAYHCRLKVSGAFSFLAKWIFGKALRAGIAAEMNALKNKVEDDAMA